MIPVIQLLGTYIKVSTSCYRDNCSSTLTVATFIIARNQIKPRYLFIDEWIMKMSCIYTMDYYLVVNKKENVKFSSNWIELDRIIGLIESSLGMR